MESRQVTLLRKGYFLGRLDFKYTHPYSRLRETHILSELEKEQLAESVRLNVLVNASYLSTVPKAGADLQKQLQTHLELTLPYLTKSSKMADIPKTKEELSYWKEFLKNKSKDVKEKK